MVPPTSGRNRAKAIDHGCSALPAFRFPVLDFRFRMDYIARTDPHGPHGQIQRCEIAFRSIREVGIMNAMCPGRLSFLTGFLFALLGAAAVAGEPAPRPIELWPAGAPGATGDSEEDRPAITPYLPSPGKNTGTAILICPGGGFMTRAVDHEGVLIARWFQARGGGLHPAVSDPSGLHDR